MERNANGDEIMVLDQIRVGDEYRYRDRATGHEYTAIEARAMKAPSRVVYLTDQRGVRRMP